MTALVAAGTWAIRGAGRFLVVADDPRGAEVAIVLSGNPVTRVPRAAALYQAGLTRRIVLTTVAGPGDALAGFVPSPTEQARFLLGRLGVPDSVVLVLPDSVSSTRDEARVAALRLTGVRRIAIVTSDIHTRRARCTFRRAMGRDVVVAAVPGFSTTYDPAAWWRSEEGLQAVVMEWLKTAYHFPC